MSYLNGIVLLVVGFCAGAVTFQYMHPVSPESHPYDRCVQLLGKYITSTINPVQAEVLIDSCLKKRKHEKETK